jgi:hypothetical protein
VSDYRVKTGHNVALGSLTTIAPSPRSVGVKATRRTHAASGLLYDEGLHITLVYDVLEDATALTALLTQFGLHTATTANVTLYCPNQMHAYTRYNGVCVRPEVSRDNYFLRGIEIVVRELVAL